jgi:hypothetical protein
MLGNRLNLLLFKKLQTISRMNLHPHQLPPSNNPRVENAPMTKFPSPISMTLLPWEIRVMKTNMKAVRRSQPFRCINPSTPLESSKSVFSVAFWEAKTDKTGIIYMRVFIFPCYVCRIRVYG